MQHARIPLLRLAVLTALAIAGPARADKVICDGNPLCLVVVVPVLVAGAATGSLTPEPPSKHAAKAIDSGHNAHLTTILQSNPALLQDPDTSHGLLLTAAAAGNLEATTILLDAGVLANYGNSQVLAYAKTVQEVRLLLSRGAVAEQMNLIRMVSRLREPAATELLTAILDSRRSLDRNDPGALGLLGAAAGARQFALARLLLQRGVNPNGKPDQSMLVALAYACNEGDAACEAGIPPLAREFIDKGADVNFAETPTCKTPLQAATQRNNQALIALLKSAGARDGSFGEYRCRSAAKTE